MKFCITFFESKFEIDILPIKENSQTAVFNWTIHNMNTFFFVKSWDKNDYLVNLMLNLLYYFH